MASFLPITLFSDQYRIFLTAIVFLVSAFIFSFPLRKSKRLNLPPGPPGWPVVGNLFQVAGSGKPFFQYVRELLPIYGPILTLKMGTRTMIIISSAELAHEALIQKGQVFANRPRENPTRKIFSVNKFTVNSALYGPVWRSLRRNMVQNMLSNSKLKEFQEVRVSAVDLMIDRMKSEAESNHGVVSVLKHVRFATFCILVSMCFGVEMDGSEIEKIDQMMKKVLIILDPRIDDYLPILAPFFSKQRKQAMQVREEQLKTLIPYIEARRSILQNRDRSGRTAAKFSYLDTLYDLKIEGRKSTPTNDELVTLCSEFLNGGTDTTATALEWAVARLIEKPEIQSRLYDEIKSTVGDRTVDEKDVESMVYLKAVTKELLRKHPPTYFSLTHAVTEPATLGGYDVPTDANVEIFLSGISEDDRVWSDPKEFNPDRFLSGKDDADITGVKDAKMIPFGAGRRICPGLSMASLHIDLMLARMVQEFQWKPLPSQKMSDFSEKLEFTVVMNPALQAVISPRK